MTTRAKGQDSQHDEWPTSHEAATPIYGQWRAARGRWISEANWPSISVAAFLVANEVVTLIQSWWRGVLDLRYLEREPEMGDEDDESASEMGDVTDYELDGGPDDFSDTDMAALEEGPSGPGWTDGESFSKDSPQDQAGLEEGRGGCGHEPGRTVNAVDTSPAWLKSSPEEGDGSDLHNEPDDVTGPATPQERHNSAIRALEVHQERHKSAIRALEA